ncbi:MAG TPA: DNA (cytosine-5-)-methyltransferase [Candidatus Paceibacterota bacterium]|nr:DNA (cytosine-5-)-methyltransferase [Candidatus Paceibacterota bacterium]
MSHKHRFIDLFAGIGGMRLAFERNGAECVFSSEWDQFAQKTYFANFGEFPAGDITQIDEADIPRFDILVGGFPCQPFSSIGKRQGFEHETQGTLFHDIARIIAHHKPKAFLLENVSGLVTHDHGRTLKIILETLNDLGYRVEYRILDAANFRVPQKRARIYIVGFNRKKVKSAEFLYPSPRKGKVGIGKFIETGRDDLSISKHLQKVYMNKVDDGRPEIVTTESEIQVKTLVATYHKIQRLTGTFVQDGPTGLRLLSEAECKAIMGFPKSFKVPVSRTQMYRQFGNSVAVPVVEAVAKSMIEHLDSFGR